MAQVVLGRWGRSLALRLPHEIANKLHLSEGEVVELYAVADSIVIHRPKSEYNLEEMFAGHSPEEWRAIYAGAYDWGPDRGREIIEE